ncbi:MAG: phosphotransferase enzyme family protein [Sphingomonadales bacterium]|nr:phosphotransferase enzyme family protein [Sphingomonadales bacterium]
MIVDRQAVFGGTEVPPAHLALDLDTLTEYLRLRIPGLRGPLSAEKFTGGQSNPTYRIVGITGPAYVLRRKPPGKLVASAHQIDREYRVLEAVGRAGLPVPKTYFYCSDESVIGSEFYIAECVEGRVFWQAELPGLSPPCRAVIYDEMNGALARLHDLDWRAAGLGDLGRHEGYTARNLARWSDIYEKSALEPIADMDALIAALPALLPVDEPVSFIHGDYGLYNLIIDPVLPRVRAILDWEMATLGNPLIDLAHHLRAWWDIPDDGGATSSLLGQDLAALGIPDIEEYVALYCARRRIAVPEMRFYLAFAQFRYAAMIQGILKRAQDGTASSRIVLHRQERVFEIARMARRTLES